MSLCTWTNVKGDKKVKERLIQAAKEARGKAYVPYSNFKVGAALYTTSGNLYTGANIENASYSLTCCAERTAIFKAVSEGETDFQAIAITADCNGPVSPCGACRQVMAEFFNEHVKIILTNTDGAERETTIDALLPNYFTL